MKQSALKPGMKALARGSTFAAKPKPLKRSPMQNETRPRRSTLKQGTGFAASPAQRRKVAAQVCAVCHAEVCDPAHLAPRALGRGCDSPACVIALCRLHHEAFDRGALDLLPHLSGAGFEVELAHMQSHYSDPLLVLVRLSGTYWVPDTSRSAA
jgi:hypothetical protein